MPLNLRACRHDNIVLFKTAEFGAASCAVVAGKRRALADLQATARFKLFRMTSVYFRPTPGLYSAGDINLKKTATA